MNTNVFFKYRSVTACMKASYETMSDQLSSILRKTWWAMLLYAVLLALTCYFRMPNKSLHDWGEQSPWASFCLQTIIYIATWFANFLSGATIWKWINQKSLGTNMLRFFPIFFLYEFFIALFIILGKSGIETIFTTMTAKAIATQSPQTTAYVTCAALSFLLLLITMVIVLPFAYIVPHVMLLPRNAKMQLWKTYVKGLRNMGNIFLLGFLSTLIMGIIASIVLIPTYIMIFGQTFSQLGALQGDPLGVPTYFTPLLIILLTLSIFVLLYIGTWAMLAYAYLYGSNEEKYQRKINNED